MADNLLNRQFNPETLHIWWSGDITYLRTAQGWLYLAIILKKNSELGLLRQTGQHPDYPSITAGDQ